MRPERQLQTACLAIFRGYDILCAGFNRERAGRARASHIGCEGLPDILGVLPDGRAFCCELKVGDAKPTVAQLAVMRALAQRNAFVCLVRTVEQAQDAARRATKR